MTGFEPVLSSPKLDVLTIILHPGFWRREESNLQQRLMRPTSYLTLLRPEENNFIS